MLCYGYLNYLFIYDVGLGREQVADCGSHFPAAVLIDCRENKPPPKKKANKKIRMQIRGLLRMYLVAGA